MYEFLDVTQCSDSTRSCHISYCELCLHIYVCANGKYMYACVDVHCNCLKADPIKYIHLIGVLAAATITH